MPKKTFLNGVPFSPLRVIDIQDSLSGEILNQLTESLSFGEGISMLLRKKGKAPNRGGYFFHFKKSANYSYDFFDFEGNFITNTKYILELINHISGSIYSEEMYEICQKQINLRNDP